MTTCARSAEHAKLGRDLVMQTAFGDSGHTTFFIANEDDFDRHKDEIVNEPEVKIMKRINCRGATIEACATQLGHAGRPAADRGGGRQSSRRTRAAGAATKSSLAPSAKECARRRATWRQFGNQLLQEGYRGYFDLDFLIDQDSGEVYLGELNPRICGASPMTNHAAFAYADAPLFLFHLLEFCGVPFDLNVEEINERWAQPDSSTRWSQVVIKSTEDKVDHVTHAPATGIYRMGEDGTVGYQRFDYNRQAIDSEREAFFLRITGPATTGTKARTSAS